jgi:PAS domain S-box-containing protein
MSSADDDLRRENEELKSRLARAERLATLVETSSEAIVSTATDGTIVSWNAAAERLFGFTGGEALGRNALELVPFELLAEHRDAFERARRGGPVAFTTRRRRHDGGQVAVAVTYARMAEPGGKLLGISILAHPVPTEEH